MSAMSDYLEWQLASHIFGSGTFTKPTVLAIALCSGAPTDAMTGATIPEMVNTGAYARQTLNPSATNWLDPIGTDGICYNLVQVDFPTATASWGWVSGVAIATSATYGAGQMLVRGSLTTPKVIDSGDALRIPVSGMAFTFA